LFEIIIRTMANPETSPLLEGNAEKSAPKNGLGSGDTSREGLAGLPLEKGYDATAACAAKDGGGDGQSPAPPCPCSGGEHPRPSPNVADFYYRVPANPTVQRYYRFTASPATPFIALYKRPLDAYLEGDGATAPQHDTTGMLTRSLVLPSHGTDPSGRWILVSVGGEQCVLPLYNSLTPRYTNIHDCTRRPAF
jgi:hypothetical protein